MSGADEHTGAVIGTVEMLARYPVKSMGGEEVESLFVESDGCTGDRRYAIESDAAPPGMLRVAGHERRQLLRYQATWNDGTVLVRTPTGVTVSVDDTRFLEHFPGFSACCLTHSQRAQTDCRPISLIGSKTIAELADELGTTLDWRRFRANFYLKLDTPFAEDGLVGETIRLGNTATLRILERDPRCRFITLDPETTEPLPMLMTLLHRRHQSRARVYASVVTPGLIRRNDTVLVVSQAD